MKFKVLKIHGDAATSSGYGCEGFAVGDVIDIAEPLAEKAAGNPDFEVVKAKPKAKAKANDAD